jgi:hypothetical protein
MWVELPRPLNSKALFEEALSHGVCFAPGDAFSASDRYLCRSFPRRPAIRRGRGGGRLDVRPGSNLEPLEGGIEQVERRAPP